MLNGTTKNLTIPDELRQHILSKEQILAAISTRRVLAFARKIPALGLARALEATVLNKLAIPDRAVVQELAQRHLPGLESVTTGQ